MTQTRSAERLDRLRGKIVDFRLRPPTGPYRNFFTPTVVGAVNRILGMPTPRSYSISTDPFPNAEDRAIAALVDEMDSVGVRLGVMNGRHSVNRPVPVHIEDSDLAELSARTGNRVLGLAGVDFDKPTEEIIEGLDIAMKEHGLVGVCLEPGLAREPMYADDERLFPLYEKIADLGVPLLFMSGPLAGPDISYTDPVRFDRVARRHPSMPVILGHGCYPYANEAVALAFKSEATGVHNVFVSPDVYMFAPGGETFVKGVNWLPNRFVYASAYSFAGVAESVLRTVELDLTDDALDAYMYRNAESLLRPVLGR
ncbi:amidohydrolase family protein [Rhodococcus aetherivorans]|uniref:Amidohydrolase family protein n=1 Tax=Rhodococcus aetherivorans TaxID=191292 RepID=A0AA46NVQ8_9NOCA|nr:MULTISPECIES: amidohydrolase family protein [Rhodococcus]QIX52909.1 amidohydrolase family protein [Rhodococcus sp. DMU1]UGQ41419.1 amidohydrolase family protein [Rhodococcus aetherivorans]UYF94529.1 amidohydrolase family protein [Rhodococcus aetherivorans]